MQHLQAEFVELKAGHAGCVPNSTTITWPASKLDKTSDVAAAAATAATAAADSVLEACAFYAYYAL
jgi:hypothetical protein